MRLSDDELETLKAERDRTLRGLSLLARVGEHLGETPVIVGGFAVETYTQGGYVTADVDAIIRSPERAKQLLVASGFERSGRHVLSVTLDLAVEFPGRHLDDLDEHARVNRIEVPGGVVEMIGVDDLVIDRLCALVHGGATGEDENALRLVAAHFEHLDRPYLRAKADRERVRADLDRVLRWAEDLRR